jgi:hypothetical protein
MPGFAAQRHEVSPYYCYQDVLGRLTRGGGTIHQHGFTIEVKPDDDSEEQRCQAKVVSPKGEIVFEYADWGIGIVPVSGKDINGDGQPDAVLEEFSGGAHCCWEYSIISLGQRPGLIRDFKNRAPASFEDLKGDGRIEILVRDGGFDDFDGVAHPFSPFPLLILRLRGHEFQDVGSEFGVVYEKEIRDVRKGLKAVSLEEFLHSDPTQIHDDIDYEETKHAVSLIVLDYLFSGKPQEAWKALEVFWPPTDRERIRNEMLDRYCNGLRKNLGVAAGPPCQAWKNPESLNIGGSVAILAGR